MCDSQRVEMGKFDVSATHLDTIPQVLNSSSFVFPDVFEIPIIMKGESVTR